MEGTQRIMQAKCLVKCLVIHSQSLISNCSFYYKIETPTLQPFPKNSLKKLSSNALRQESANFSNSKHFGPCGLNGLCTITTSIPLCIGDAKVTIDICK